MRNFICRDFLIESLETHNVHISFSKNFMCIFVIMKNTDKHIEWAANFVGAHKNNAQIREKRLRFVRVCYPLPTKTHAHTHNGIYVPFCFSRAITSSSSSTCFRFLTRHWLGVCGRAGGENAFWTNDYSLPNKTTVFPRLLFSTAFSGDISFHSQCARLGMGEGKEVEKHSFSCSCKKVISLFSSLQ